ncbi:MAG: type VI secretion system lipoprotein TssJ [Rhodospirillales bacterium]|nr:type VI secretion system lipoprotein TssJ [Rhodospirillales bacterium]
MPALAGALLLGACAKEPPPPGVIDLAIKAGTDINPGPDGTPAPALVRVYQLASPVKFQNADFFLLFEKEADTLGADLLGREEISVSPGETKTLNQPLKPSANHVGVAAAFRDIDKATWRAVVEVPPHGTTKLESEVRKLEIDLKTVERDSKEKK